MNANGKNRDAGRLDVNGHVEEVVCEVLLHGCGAVRDEHDDLGVARAADTAATILARLRQSGRLRTLLA